MINSVLFTTSHCEKGIILERDGELTKEIIEFSQSSGIDVIGFADPENIEPIYLAENQPKSIFPGVKTVIIVGMHLYDLVLDAWSYGEEKNIQFADSVVVILCNRIKKFLREKGFTSKTVSYGPGLYLKEWGALAGIGPIGKNNLLLTKDFGPQVRLRAILTDAPLSCGTPIKESSYCTNCTLCIEACPAGALEDGKYNKIMCNNYALKHLKFLSNNSVIWCNECIESCPVGDKRKKNYERYDFSNQIIPEN